jgi:transposase
MCPVFIKAKEVAFMRRTEVLQEYRQMRFEKVYTGWKSRELTQEQAANILGVCARTFRRLIPRYEDAGLAGLIDKRLNQASHRCAPLDEVLSICDLYKQRYSDFNVKHFYKWYIRNHEGQRSYTWVKNTLQGRNLVKKAKNVDVIENVEPESPIQA